MKHHQSVEPSQEATFSRVAERIRQIADNAGASDTPLLQNSLYAMADSVERILKDASEYADKQQREITELRQVCQSLREMYDGKTSTWTAEQLRDHDKYEVVLKAEREEQQREIERLTRWKACVEECVYDYRNSRESEADFVLRLVAFLDGEKS